MGSESSTTTRACGRNDPSKSAVETVFAEQAILKAMIHDFDFAEKASRRLKEEWFLLELHRQIFAALVPMLDTGRGYEVHRIVSTLKSIERIAQGEGEAYVVQLASGVTDLEPAKYFELLEDHACKRALGFHADWILQHIDDRDMTGIEEQLRSAARLCVLV